MTLFDDLLKQSASRHQHLCPRQVLGVRMGLYAGKLLGLELPQADKRLITLVETDGCLLDGVSVATGCNPGRRTLFVRDYGKMAATFVDQFSGAALRIAPQADARAQCLSYVDWSPDRWQAYLQGYQLLGDEVLLLARPVSLNFSLADLISMESARAVCQLCGEEIFNQREVRTGESLLCRACAGQAYYKSEIASREPR